jgi:hypothetical protein
MRSRKAKSKAIMHKGFLHLHRPLLECQDFISLKGNSIKLLIDLGSQYNGYNNGDLCASLSLMRKRGWNSNQQLAKALKELLERNLIVQTKQGGLNLGPNLYAITWEPIHECNGKLDAKPTTVAPRSFR